MTGALADEAAERNAWRLQLERTSLALLATFAAAAAYLALYATRDVFDLRFLLLVAAASLAVALRAWAPDRRVAGAAGWYAGIPAILSALLVVSWEDWAAYAAAPLIIVAALTRPGADLALLAAVVAAVALRAGDADSAQLLPVAAILGLTVVLAHLLRRSIHATFGWYARAAADARAALENARTHRAQLASALKTERIALALQERAQIEILHAKRQADEAKRMKEQFAANISHELRTPLNIILGFSELMHSSPHVYANDPFPPKLRRDIAHIYYSSKHLVNLIDDILDLSRFEASEFQLACETTTLEAIVAGALDTAREIFRDSSVQLVVGDLSGLPFVHVDSARIQQVLINLLTNAHKHTAQGSVTISARSDGATVILSVCDTGRGIPPNELTRIFDEYYQVDLSFSRPYQGAGLGLAICRRLVEAHGGRIWAESFEGQGARFFVALPCSAALSAPRTHSADPAYRIPVGENGEGRRVAVVDPDPALAALVARSLHGAHVVHAPALSPVSAADSLPEVDLVISNTPGSPAHAAARPGVPTIACALPSRADMMAAYGIGLCLTKPVASSQILAAMTHFGSPRTVVMVDDDRGFCHLIGQVLGNYDSGIRFASAYGVAQGFRLVEELQPDLLIVDLMLGAEDGRDLLRGLRMNPATAQVPALLLTATDSASTTRDLRSPTICLAREPGFSTSEVLRILAAITGALGPAAAQSQG